MPLLLKHTLISRLGACTNAFVLKGASRLWAARILQMIRTGPAATWAGITPPGQLRANAIHVDQGTSWSQANGVTYDALRRKQGLSYPFATFFSNPSHFKTFLVAGSVTVDYRLEFFPIGFSVFPVTCLPYFFSVWDQGW